MAETVATSHCLQMPIDHRLRTFLRPALPLVNPFVSQARHVNTLDKYGKTLLSSSEKISLPEIAFARRLALPETKGGVLVLLLQPAPNQHYDQDFDTIVQECETLRAVDNVLRSVIGSSLEETSCFDAFPFQKVSVTDKRDTGYSEYEEAYDVFREMVIEKQPDVVLCCYHSPDRKKFDLLYSRGVGKTREYSVQLQDQFRCIPVNAFHPSYAVNHNRGESCFRTLYMVEVLQAFHKFNGSWTEKEWMGQLRSFCMDRAKHLAREKGKTPQFQPFERWERSFQDGLTGLKSFSNLMCSDSFTKLDDEELYNRVISDDISRLTCDCLLVINVVLDEQSRNNAPHSSTRDAGSVGVSIRKSILQFAIDNLKESVQMKGKDIECSGIPTPEGLLRSCGVPKSWSGLRYILARNLHTLMVDLGNSFFHEGDRSDSFALRLIKEAFSTFADGLEHALGQHLAGTTKPKTEETSLDTPLASLRIDETQGDRSEHARPAPFAPYRKEQISPQKQPVALQAVTSSQIAQSDVCFQCKQPGHFRYQCTQTICYRCDQKGHYSKSCPRFPSTPQKKRRCASHIPAPDIVVID